MAILYVPSKKVFKKLYNFLKIFNSILFMGYPPCGTESLYMADDNIGKHLSVAAPESTTRLGVVTWLPWIVHRHNCCIPCKYVYK